MNIIKKETSLQTFKTDDGLEVIINTKTGESFTSIRGYSRIGNITPAGIRKRLNKGGYQNRSEIAEVLTAGGIQGGYLITEDIIADWLPYDNPQMATAFMKLGIRMYMHTIAGFEPRQELTKADLASMKQEIINEVRSNMEPVTTLSNKIERFTNSILEKMNALVKAQPTVNKIHAVIPAGYITYEDFKSKRNYAFKRGAWNYLTDRISKDKIIPKTGFNRIEYFDEDTIMKTLIDLEAKRELKLSNGITGRAAKTTISII